MPRRVPVWLRSGIRCSNELPRMSNPLPALWSGPFGGRPPFDKVRVADFKPALEAAMAENLAEIDKIAKNPSAPTFENTLLALER
jgi:peptidyl-dipeptidase Dcp